MKTGNDVRTGGNSGATVNSQKNSGGTTEGRPLWQRISGIDPKRENEMTRDERDAAIRKLVQEVHRRAIVEFESDDEGKIPEDERSIFWDPLQRICMQLGISRTKLSNYSRELTGLRAHELSDRIRAKRKLPERLTKWVQELVGLEMNSMRASFAKMRIDGRVRQYWMGRMVKTVKSFRTHELRAHFAGQMGFANFSRVSRACLLAFGKSLDHIEADLVRTYVQKFFDEFILKTKGEPPRRRDHQEQQVKERELTPDAQKIIDDAVKFALGGRKKEAHVA